MRARPLAATLLTATAMLTATALLLTACGSAAPAGNTAASGGTAVAGPTAAAGKSGSPAGPVKGSGRVNVLYAGSLVNLMEKQVGPAFNAATGYTFTGFAGGSTALAAQIKGHVHAADVFISASPSVNASLQGSANGDWVSWYARYASSALVIGYNPNSRFAAALTSKPWYQVVTEPGFLLGSTDPATDPKGKLAVTALRTAAAAQHDPALQRLATSTANVYPEETLVGRLQAGQLDAGFFYSSEATAAHLPTVPLSGQHLQATYTVTVLNRAPDPAGAAAFVAFLLGPGGRASLQQDGFALTTPPAVTGTGVPGTLRTLLPAK